MRVVQAVMLVTTVMHQPMHLVRAMPVSELMFWARASLAMRRLTTRS